jgi:hypothetical protein
MRRKHPSYATDEILVQFSVGETKIKTDVYARVGQKDDFVYEFRRKVSPY